MKWKLLYKGTIRVQIPDKVKSSRSPEPWNPWAYCISVGALNQNRTGDLRLYL